MRTTPFFPPRVLSLVATATAVLFAAVAPAKAAVVYQTVYQTDFNGAAGAFPGSNPTYADWTTKRSGTATPTTLSLNGSGVLQMANAAGATGSQFTMALYEGSSSQVSNGKVTSVVQFVSNSNQSMGIMARVQNPTADGARPTGYFAGIWRDGTTNRLVISKDIQFTDVGTYSIAASNAISVSNFSYYRLEFEFEGDKLTASLFSTSNGSLITSISVTDSSYTTGVTGLRTNFRSDDRTVGYESFQLEAIPEPATAALLIPAGIAGLLLRRKLQ